MNNNATKKYYQPNSLMESIIPFSLTSKKILMYLLSKSVEIEDNIEQSVNVEEYCEMYLMNFNKKYYTTIKDAYQELTRNTILIKEDKSYVEMSIFQHIRYDEKKEKIIAVKFSDIFHEKILKEMIELKNKKFWYAFLPLIQFNDPSTIDLYNFLKGCKNNKDNIKVQIGLNELRKKLNKDTKYYQEYNKFKTKFLKKAINEISEKTDIIIILSNEIKKGRKVDELVFSVTEKKDFVIDNYLKINDKISKRKKDDDIIQDAEIIEEITLLDWLQNNVGGMKTAFRNTVLSEQEIKQGIYNICCDANSRFKTKRDKQQLIKDFIKNNKEDYIFAYDFEIEIEKININSDGSDYKIKKEDENQLKIQFNDVLLNSKELELYTKWFDENGFKKIEPLIENYLKENSPIDLECTLNYIVNDVYKDKDITEQRRLIRNAIRNNKIYNNDYDTSKIKLANISLLRDKKSNKNEKEVEIKQAIQKIDKIYNAVLKTNELITFEKFKQLLASKNCILEATPNFKHKYYFNFQSDRYYIKYLKLGKDNVLIR